MLVANLLSATAHTLAIDEMEDGGLAIRLDTSIGRLVSTISARIDDLVMNRDPVTDGALRQTRGMCTPHREHTNIFHAVRGRPSSHGHAVESARSKLCADRPPYTQICEQRGPFAQVNCEWTYSSCGRPSASASFHRVVRLAWRTRARGPSASRSSPSSSPPKSFGALDDARGR